MPETIVVEKEMGLSRSDFLRLLPGALGSDSFTVDGDSIVFEDGSRRIEIAIAEKPERRIAKLALPVMRVVISFIGYGGDEAAQALARFERAYQRTGG